MEKAIPFTPHSYTVQWSGSFVDVHEKTVSSRSDALSLAREMRSPRYPHVSVSANCNINLEFAIAYFCYDKPETDWRTYVNGRFVGGFALEA